MRKRIKIGVVGAGAFSGDFVRLFKLHPDVAEVALADLDPEKLRQKAALLGITRTYGSLDEMLKQKDIDRILEMHISPVNISVHTTNPELRAKMMNNRFAGEALDILYRICKCMFFTVCCYISCSTIGKFKCSAV